MAKTKTTRVSVNQFGKICKSLTCDNIITHTIGGIDGEDINIEVKRFISLSEFQQFVADVKNNCFDDNGNYYATLKEFMIMVSTLRYFTNIAIPSNWSNLWDSLYQSDIVSVVLNYINTNQYTEILIAIDEQIEYEKLTQRKALEEAIKQMNEAVEQIQNMMSPENMKLIESVMKETVGRNISNEELINTLAKSKGIDVGAKTDSENTIGFVEKEKTDTK